MTAECQQPTSDRRLRPTITLVGAGNLARVLGLALHAAGYRIDEIVSRSAPESRKRARALARKIGARASTYADAQLGSEIIWLCVSDDAIASTASAIAGATNWKGKIALHSSGARSSRELEPLRRRGAAIGSLHPMQTFVRASAATLAGVSFAVEGDPGRGARGPPHRPRSRRQRLHHPPGIQSALPRARFVLLAHDRGHFGHGRAHRRSRRHSAGVPPGASCIRFCDKLSLTISRRARLRLSADQSIGPISIPSANILKLYAKFRVRGRFTVHWRVPPC